MPPMIVRKLPVEVESYILTQESCEEIIRWVTKHGGLCSYSNDGLVIETLEGSHLARWNDWVIKGVRGEFYPCKPGIAAETYEIVNDD